MRKPFALVILLVLLCASFTLDCRLNLAAADEGDLAGKYRVIGWEPGDKFDSQPTYSGTIVVRKRGDAYHFEGIVDEEQFVGVGFLRPEEQILCFAFKGLKSGRVGQTVLELEGGILSGKWTYLEDSEGKVGKEIWKRLD